MMKFNKCPSFFTGILLVFALSASGQFAPPAGQPGTTAMYMDSSAFTNWAKSCVVTRGFINIEDTSASYLGSNHASYGVDADATGFPDNLVVSLGDGGSAVFTFYKPIANGPGPDFAIFENGLNDTFLELGFVEVSSNGIHYYRFPAVSNTQTTTQVSTFGAMDATLINNFAGKYRAAYGTPFDLDTFLLLSSLNINRITHLRIVDVVGCIQPGYATFDANDNIVNERWPTPFDTGGLDLDAVGVIHEGSVGIDENKDSSSITIYPNPVTSGMILVNREKIPARFILCNPEGKILMGGNLGPGSQSFDLSGLHKGIFIGKFIFRDGRTETEKIIKI
jgi:hypothetical protein